MKYIIQGRCQDEYGQELSGVNVNISYWFSYMGTDNTQKYVLANSTQLPKAVTDSKGKFKLTVDTYKTANNPNYSIVYDNPEKPFQFTFSKNGYQLGIIKNPIFSTKKYADEIILTTNPEFKSYIDPVKGGTLSITDQYESGKWKISSISEDKRRVIDEELSQLYTFVSNNPRNSRIYINSSESRPTNSDNEENSPTYKQKLPAKDLAKKRATNLKEYVIQKLQEFSIANPNPNFILPEIVINDPIIGTEPWPDTNKNKELLELENKINQQRGEPLITNPAQLSRYKKEQWVELNAELIIKRTGCVKNGYIVFDVSYVSNNHGCDSAVYEVYANGKLLKRDDGKPFASLNNLYELYFSTQATIQNDFISKFKIDNNIPLNDQANFNSFITAMKQYDNVASGYHKPSSTSISIKPGRFKERETGEPFPTPTTPFPPDQIPETTKDSGKRYNRFILTPDLIKQITESTGSEEIKFSIKCQGMYKGNQQIVTSKYGRNCHAGVGDFNLYKLTPDSTGNLKVEYTSYPLSGKSPEIKDEFLYLFTFDPCDNRIIDKNTKVFDISYVQSLD
jgi:hypothetical protein